MQRTCAKDADQVAGEKNSDDFCKLVSAENATQCTRRAVPSPEGRTNAAGMNGRRIARSNTFIGPPSEVIHLLNANAASSVRWQSSKPYANDLERKMSSGTNRQLTVHL